MREEVFKIILICLGAGVALLASAIKRHRRLRKVQDTPRSKASSAPQGYAELQGFAWPQSGWMNNSLGQPAVYYHFQLQKLVTKGSGKNKKKEWVTVFQTLFNSPFYLIDPTGAVAINPQLSDLEIESQRTQKWTTLEHQAKARLLAEVITGHIDSFPPSEGMWGLFSSSFRICESEILAGSPLHASGDFKSQSATPEKVAEVGMTEFANRVFDLPNRTFRNFTRILDSNKDGKLNASEAKNGFAALANSILKSTKKETGEQTFDLHGYLQSTPSHRLFLSDSHEEQLVQKLKSFLMLRFVGGGALVCAGLILVLLQFQPDLSFYPRQRRAVASTSEQEGHQDQPNILHQKCQTEKQACLKLLKMRDQLRLTEKHIWYYKAKACEHGHQDSCSVL